MQIKKYLNHHKKDKSGLTPIWFDITTNGWQYKMSTGEKITPSNWSEDRRVTKKQAGYVAINSRLDNLYNYIDNIGHKYGKALGKEEFKRLLKEYRVDQVYEGASTLEEQAPPLPFFELMEEWIAHQSTKTKAFNGKKLAKQTITGLHATIKRLNQFSLACNYPLSLENMDLKFYSKFLSYMVDDLDQSSNTFAKHIKRLKTFLHYCEDELELEVNKKYKKFEVVENYDEVDFLYEEELIRIREFDFFTEGARKQIQQIAIEENGVELNALQIEQRINTLNEMRDVFLMCCYTGLRKSDVFTLEPRHIQRDLIIKKAGKTEVTCYIPFFDDELFRPVELVEKYRGRYKTCLPVNQSINEYLSDMARLVGITRVHITSKLGRKTFVTLKRYQGVDDRIIMRATGHQTEKSFLRYAGTDTAKIIQAFRDKPFRSREAS